jgi:hypothetical protein
MHDRLIANRGKDYALVYTYTGKTITIDLSKIAVFKNGYGGMIRQQGRCNTSVWLKTAFRLSDPKEVIGQE